VSCGGSDGYSEPHRHHGYRSKRPQRKRRAVALDVPAIVITRSVGNRQMPPPVDNEPEPAAPPPAKDDNPTEPAPPPAAKPAIVSATSKKRAKPLRAERGVLAADDPEADAAMRAWIQRAGEVGSRASEMTAPDPEAGQRGGR
jgi:hypothetical protein